MARFDVYAHPDTELRKVTPFLLDVQNSYIDSLATRVVLPLRLASEFHAAMRGLNPAFEVRGKKVVLDTAAIGAFPASGIGKPIADLTAQSIDIVSALDTLFGSY
ncbi:CcdB family protein [Ramlibacter sp. H39-3-26]|uniref:CcdB family protein n=1 Tax=Curvibacter soli TaxID=3031331 RepID=UPI0023DC6704|nr:CcdB family protein [Ramlibacter sp. H39-3-26]MDF1484043.1 CcdB family protein [Ramlibacter sp. H39-3-26]